MTMVSIVWGAALYVALTSSSPSRPQLDEDFYVTLLVDAEQETATEVERQRETVVGGGRNRRLNGATVDRELSPAVSETPLSDTDFSIREPFHFPLPLYSQEKEELLASPWVSQLQAFLRGVRGNQISMVTASVEHQDVLLNWLISASLVASPPLQDILVLTLDKSVLHLISRRNISTLYVSEEMVVRPSANVTRRFSQIHVVRLSVLRLLNHYGFSVVNYDCDAIVLRNPQSIFDGHRDADLIGTFGKGPGHLYSKWGITLNTGVMLLRSNPKIGGCGLFHCVWGRSVTVYDELPCWVTLVIIELLEDLCLLSEPSLSLSEKYWELMSKDASKYRSTTDDQANINIALEKANIRSENNRRNSCKILHSLSHYRWFNFDKTKNIDNLERPVYGLANDDIIVMLLPENKVCMSERERERERERDLSLSVSRYVATCVILVRGMTTLSGTRMPSKRTGRARAPSLTDLVSIAASACSVSRQLCDILQQQVYHC